MGLKIKCAISIVMSREFFWSGKAWNCHWISSSLSSCPNSWNCASYCTFSISDHHYSAL